VVEDKETFLSRWSRRKLKAKEDAPAGAQHAGTAPVAPLAPAAEPPAAGTAKDSSAEYREFFDPQVEEKLRRGALKKLFGDPHFNVMDGLDTYVDDYSKPDPIPEAMLRQLNQAKDLFLFDDENKTNEGAADPAAAGAPAAPAAAAEATALPEAPPANASDEASSAAASTADKT